MGDLHRCYLIHIYGDLRCAVAVVYYSKQEQIFLMNNEIIDGGWVRCQVVAFENVELIQCSLLIVV